MAYPKTRFETNDPETRKKWAKDLFKVTMNDLEYNALVGTGTDAAVQLKTELSKDKQGGGDQITFSIRLPLIGEGVFGRDTVEGNEESLRYESFSMTIEELNHAVDTGGRMDQQRVPWNLMQDGRDGLKDWWAELFSNYIINVIAGNSLYAIAGHTVFGQAITEPDIYHYLGVNQSDNTAVATVDSAIDADCAITLAFLDRMKQKAENYDNTDYNFKIRKFGAGGKSYYRVLLHNYVFDHLRRNTNVAEWGDMQRAAGKLKMPEVEIEYNGMLISKSSRVPLASGKANVYRCVLFGPQAACWAFGGAGESNGTAMAFVPYTKDAERYVMIRAGAIFGCKKVGFQNKDFAIVTGASWGAKIS
jgi:N4-gp56 family major capsid protein